MNDLAFGLNSLALGLRVNFLNEVAVFSTGTSGGACCTSGTGCGFDG